MSPDNLDINAFLAEISQDNPQDDKMASPAEKVSNMAEKTAMGWARNDSADGKRFSLVPIAEASASAKEDQKKAVIAKREKTAQKNNQKRLIISAAISDPFVDLNSTLTVDHKKLLIKKLTASYTEKMQHHDGYINATIEDTLKRMIPNDLLLAFAKYPDVVVPFPGFTYTAGEKYGGGLSFKANPKIPYYFKPDDCTSIINEVLPENRIASLERTIVFFFKYKKTRDLREIKIAETLTKIVTFFQLLKKDPFWYEILINELKNNAQTRPE